MTTWIPRGLLAAWIVCTAACSSGTAPRVAPDPIGPSTKVTLAGQFSIKPLTQFPAGTGPRFGGISGLAATDDPSVFIAISDDHVTNRVYRLRMSGNGPGFRIDPLEFIPLQAPPGGSAELDPEGITLAPRGNMIIVAEGSGNVEPRIPPSVNEYGPRGAFVRSLPVRDRFVPNPTGPQTKGVRSNLGFEAATVTRNGRLFVGTEATLVQDGPLTTFEKGAPSRILEYLSRAGSEYRPAREFVYIVEPIPRPSFEAGLAVNGLVELLPIDEDVFLALERSFVAETGNTGRNMNRIQVFMIDLRGAADVSGIESLKDAAFTPVKKVPLFDLSNVPGLSPDLAPSLDNFEALVFGPTLPDGRRSLILASDDNFNVSQRTWFLLFAVDGLASRQIQ